MKLCTVHHIAMGWFFFLVDVVIDGKIREKVEIPATKAYISMEGAGAEKTVIEWDDTADRSGPKGRPLGTFGSATVAVNSPYFIAKNITFKVCISLSSLRLCLVERIWRTYI